MTGFQSLGRGLQFLVVVAHAFVLACVRLVGFRGALVRPEVPPDGPRDPARGEEPFRVAVDQQRQRRPRGILRAATASCPSSERTQSRKPCFNGCGARRAKRPGMLILPMISYRIKRIGESFMHNS